MSRVFTQALDQYASEQLAALPQEIRTLISRANNDLYCGPSYYDSEGNEVSCFDDGAIAFHFSAAVKAIRNAVAAIHDIYIDDDGFVCTSEPQGDWYDGEEPTQENGEEDSDFEERRESLWCEPVDYCRVDASEIISVMLGSELASYI